MNDDPKWHGRETIERLTGRLHGSITHDDEGTAITTAIRLLEHALIDLNRIADALEKLANL